MDGLNKLIQDMEQELNKNSNNDSQMADGFEPTTYESHSGNSDETLLSHPRLLGLTFIPFSEWLNNKNYDSQYF